ncbi:MAG TPA: outer membrane lipoprotein chaperone LolA [Terriglobales bacterium]|nr:outer membrane lipoprotein chaperone LolA [Terriglobales bacterium]
MPACSLLRRHFLSPQGDICVSPEGGTFARVAVCLLFVAGLAAAATAPEIAAKVDQRYNRLQTLQADFTETYHGAGVSRTESGMLWLKRPGKMLWDYREPRPKMFVIDGKTAWFYAPGERQARKAAAKKLDDLRSPLRYLLGKTKLERELAGLSLATDIATLAPGDIALRGVPRGMENRVSSVLLEVTPEGEIARMLVNEVDGSSTEYRFSNRRENQPVADQLFHFLPPPGVEVIEAQDLTP